MSKNQVKIVKRNKGTSEKEEVLPVAIKTEKEINRGIAYTVNNWINERRENRRMEKLMSVDKIAAWQLSPESF
jgi:hypothetical protein